MPRRPYALRVQKHGCCKFDNEDLWFAPGDQIADHPVFLLLRVTNLPGPSCVTRSAQTQPAPFALSEPQASRNSNAFASALLRSTPSASSTQLQSSAASVRNHSTQLPTSTAPAGKLPDAHSISAPCRLVPSRREPHWWSQRCPSSHLLALKSFLIGFHLSSFLRKPSPGPTSDAQCQYRPSGYTTPLHQQSCSRNLCLTFCRWCVLRSPNHPPQRGQRPHAPPVPPLCAPVEPGPSAQESHTNPGGGLRSISCGYPPRSQ